MLDIVGDERLRFYTQQCTRAHLHLNCMASEKDARSRAGADAASAEHSMQTGLEVREPSSAQSLTDRRSDATSGQSVQVLLPQRLQWCADCKRHGHGTAASSG